MLYHARTSALQLPFVTHDRLVVEQFYVIPPLRSGGIASMKLPEFVAPIFDCIC